MTNEPLDELYLTWLYSQVGSVETKSPSKTYWSLLRQLYRIEFVWTVPNDDNRVEDARDLRDEFIKDEELDNVDPDWANLECSVLELLLVLARWLSFEADEGEPRRWFWHMLENLRISHISDAKYNDRQADLIENAVETFIWRKYDEFGHGNVFPLKRPNRDQREVELWYQLNAYIIENNF